MGYPLRKDMGPETIGVPLRKDMGPETRDTPSVNKHRVATCQGKVREKQNFLQVRELSGKFEKMSGNFVHFTSVRELSGNFVITINFFPKMISLDLGRGYPHLELGKGYPLSRSGPRTGGHTPNQNSIVCTCYAAGGIALAFTQ